MSDQKSPISDFLEDLTCPVCLEIQRDCKIFQCGNGHLICEACYVKVSDCPVCREKLVKPGPRSLFAEKAIKSLPVPCPHKAFGCGLESSSSDEVASHGTTCTYRPVSCPVAQCNSSSITAGSLLGHLMKLHGTKEVRVDGNVVRLDFPLEIKADAELASIATIVPFNGQLIIAVFAKKRHTYYSWIYSFENELQ